MSGSAARLLLGALDRYLGSEESAKKGPVVLRIDDDDDVSVSFGRYSVSLWWTKNQWYMESSDFKQIDYRNGDGTWQIHWYTVTGLSSAAIAKWIKRNKQISFTQKESNQYTWNGGEEIITIEDACVEKDNVTSSTFPVDIFITEYDRKTDRVRTKPVVKVIKVTSSKAQKEFAAHGVA
jgi:hypothetical protein